MADENKLASDLWDRAGKILDATNQKPGPVGTSRLQYAETVLYHVAIARNYLDDIERAVLANTNNVNSGHEIKRK